MSFNTPLSSYLYAKACRVVSNVDKTILSSICKYNPYEHNLSKMQLYQELCDTFHVERLNIVVQMITALQKNDIKCSYPGYTEYFTAIADAYAKYKEEQKE